MEVPQLLNVAKEIASLDSKIGLAPPTGQREILGLRHQLKALIED